MKKTTSLFGGALLVLVSVLLTTVAAEMVVRVADDQPLLAFPLPEPIGSPSVSAELLDGVVRAPGIERSWFFNDPEPLPNRGTPPEDWVRRYRDIEANPVGHNEFRGAELFKAWNAVFAADICRHPFLKLAPGGQLFLHDPTDGSVSPPYRFLPNATMPDGLVTNDFGWRGRPVTLERAPKTIRIAFVGASTTVDGHHLPFSYPEFVGHWLNVWAAARKLDVRFETMNAGRESVVSTDIEAIVRKEVLPLKPEMVVYYEGANQFRPSTIVPEVPAGKPLQPRQPGAQLAPEWLRTAGRWSALAVRIQAAIGMVGSDVDGREWPKPVYQVVWPQGVDERNPNPAAPNLPTNLNVILRDLDRIREDLATIDSELVLTSYRWLVRDGMVLDPVRHKYILEYLNVGNHPYRYRDMARLAAFQNRIYANYAKNHGIDFIDVDGAMPFEPDLYIDAIHNNYAGVRMKAWVVLQQLIPLIERRLADGTWPKNPVGAEQPAPIYTPRSVTFDCRQ